MPHPSDSARTHIEPHTDAPLARHSPVASTHISVRGARTHNLKNIDVDIPKHQLVVITGLSGSGKSSLAFDTLYAEGQRRYVESLSAYARQFLQMMDKPDVDVIEGLAPAISIEQKATSHNPRSTVGTVTEIHDYLRLLYARAGVPHCPEHDEPLRAMTVSQMVDATLALPAGTKLMLMAPLARNRKGEFLDAFASMQLQGYVRFRVDGQVYAYEDLPALNKNEKHDIDVVVDRLKVRAKPAPDAPEDEQQAYQHVAQRLSESFEAALRVGDQRAIVLDMDSGESHLMNARYSCPHCSYTITELEPRLFSFNSPMGACPDCDGLGYSEQFDANKVVAFPSLSLASGAIKSWERRNGYYFSMLQSVAAHYDFDLEMPFEELAPEHQHVVLHGSGEEDIEFHYTMGSGEHKGKKVTKQHPFEGVLANIKRRYRETDSQLVRDDLSRYRSVGVCPSCHGARLRTEARHVFFGQGEQRKALHRVSDMTLADAQAYFQTVELKGAKAEIAEKVLREIAARLSFLNDVGLNYLTLSRSAETLSGGEAQRIRLASQIGSGLTGVMYVLDEPSIGLHQRDNDRLIGTLQRLRDLGNSVLVVEHDEDMIRAADYVLDLGPAAGVHGGEILARGTPQAIMDSAASITGQFLTGQRSISVPPQRGAFDPDNKEHPRLTLVGARGNNLKNVTASFPLGRMTCVTGVSGSGKSTLVNDTLYREAARYLNRAKTEASPFEDIEGLNELDKVVNVDQSPIGRTPRSNPATYTGMFTPIRDLFAEMPTSRERGYKPGRFSFNVAQKSGGGRCEACQGDGVVKVEMHFLPDVYVPCDVCHGKRYARETLEVLYKGKNISQVLDMTVEEALEFFAAVPSIARKLETLNDVGLGYIRLGQPATTLSGGEAQRVKLALELSKRDTGNTLYILDEPTTGLHFADIELLLEVLQRLRDAGNTLIVIEHNLDVIKTADWIVDMGPEGGAGGGTVVTSGTPEQVAEHADSHTGRYLAQVLS